MIDDANRVTVLIRAQLGRLFAGPHQTVHEIDRGELPEHLVSPVREMLGDGLLSRVEDAGPDGSVVRIRPTPKGNRLLADLNRDAERVVLGDGERVSGERQSA